MHLCDPHTPCDLPPPRMPPIFRAVFRRDNIPWTFLVLATAAMVIQLNSAWRDALLYDRIAIAAGAWPRIWTGHFVHFGWPHFIADVGLFLILGRLLEREHPVAARLALVAMTAFISGVVFVFDPTMVRYGGLSALNLGLLVFLAGKGWQRNWSDWFWPAVLAIYIGEIVLETIARGGRGGGMIPFDDPTIHVATSAHIAGAIYGLALAAIAWLRRERKRKTDKSNNGGPRISAG